MSSEKNIELDEEYYSDKCLNGGTWDFERARACQILAMKCKDELSKIDNKEVRKIKQKILNEARLKLVESSDDIVEVEGGEPFKIWNREYGIFEENFDTKKYINTLKKDKKFGKCSIALYGLETQFWSQISEGMFQNLDNARALKNTEGLILGNSTYVTDNKDIRIFAVDEWLRDFRSSMWVNRTKDLDWKYRSVFYNVFGVEKAEKIIDSREASNFIELNRKDSEKIYNYLIDNNEIRKESFQVVPFGTLKQRICNKVHNPYITDGEFKFCSSARTSGENQQFEIWRKHIYGEQNKAFYTIPEYASKIIRDEMQEKGETSLADLIFDRDEAKILTDAYNERLSKIDDTHFAYKNIMEKRNYVAKLYQDLQLRIEKIKQEKQIKFKYEATASLGCWSNFLDLIPKDYYPTYKEGKYDEIEMALAVGEITENQALEMLKSLAQMEKEYEKNLKMEKSVTYQPTRLRLYASQVAIHNIINDGLCRLSINDLSIDNISKNTIRKGFSGINLLQLMEHKVYSQEEIDEMLEEFNAMDKWNIIEKFSETTVATDWAGEMLSEYVGDFLEDDFRKSLKDKDEQALELIFGGVENFLSHDMIKITYSPIDSDFEYEVSEYPIVIWEDDRKDEIEININDKSTWESFAVEAFPAVSTDEMHKKLLQLKDDYLYLQPTVSLCAYLDSSTLFEVVHDALSHIHDVFIDDLKEALLKHYRTNQIPLFKNSIKEEYDRISRKGCDDIDDCELATVVLINSSNIVTEWYSNMISDTELKPIEDIELSSSEFIRQYLHNEKDWLLDSLIKELL